MALMSDVTGRRGRSILPMGCIVWPGLLALSCLVGGAMAMSRWEALSGLSKAGSVALVVVGTLFLLPVLLMAAFQFTMRRMFRHLSDIEQARYVEVKQVYRVGGALPDRSELPSDIIIDASPAPNADEKH